METNQRIREHRTAFQQEKINHQIERTLEDKKLEKLKAALQAKMEPEYRQRLSA